MDGHGLVASVVTAVSLFSMTNVIGNMHVRSDAFRVAHHPPQTIDIISPFAYMFVFCKYNMYRLLCIINMAQYHHCKLLLCLDVLYDDSNLYTLAKYRKHDQWDDYLV